MTPDSSTQQWAAVTVWENEEQARDWAKSGSATYIVMPWPPALSTGDDARWARSLLDDLHEFAEPYRAERLAMAQVHATLALVEQLRHRG